MMLQWSPPSSGGSTQLAPTYDDQYTRPQWSAPFDGGSTRR